ncbi:MAG: TraR/DksA family transcriptional regulator [Patescibacteria group bacterium]|nr:TraR/DksA family transcriptional regulator [Patescibacteria group bacterium]MDE2015172.1 TraR/DksA family transcriptional regulator [Patescibacteria group bacterium]MDE2226600.1 TraR/DksA family transcriptional regulator [Patescibacteria group bacterium]
MDQTKIREYKTRLETERDNILARLKKDIKPEDFGNDVDHYDEEADEAEEMTNQLALDQDFKNRLEEINEALEKITNGKYGICENCGGEIGDKVLSVSPESRLCQNCKTAAK